MKRAKMAIILLVLTAAAQPAAAPALFQLGATRSEVQGIFGKPTRWYAPKPMKHFYTEAERSAALTVWQVDDVYSRKTGTNEYEIRVSYGLDESSSRLHPTLRVDDVTFIVDRPAPANVLLADLVELRQLCSGGCELLGMRETGERYIVAYAGAPTLADASRALSIFTHWTGKSTVPECSPRLAGYFFWEQEPYSLLRKNQPDPDWSSQKIERVRLGTACPEFEFAMAAKGGWPQPLRLGSWVPPAE